MSKARADLGHSGRKKPNSPPLLTLFLFGWKADNVKVYSLHHPDLSIVLLLVVALFQEAVSSVLADDNISPSSLSICSAALENGSTSCSTSGSPRCVWNLIN
ncbi:hypothetical protein F2Q70_00030287 [Brassica cretica]|uniref:Uncharacterized protein n=1 Tax=Brassica cretica TaxID=69181 RepID=A0A8S9FLP7_BRACR|nr:hypothetical protein F2Q70_00030287 [Brassica cretica]